MLCNLIRIQIMHLRTNFETNHKRNLWLLSLVCEYRCCFLQMMTLIRWLAAKSDQVQYYCYYVN